MKKIIFLLTINISLLSNLFSQNVLFYENFEDVTHAFDLNLTKLSSTNSGSNEWIVNNIYAGGSGSFTCFGFPFNVNIQNTPDQTNEITNFPNSTYLHLTSRNLVGAPRNAHILNADGLCTFSENNFTEMNTDVNTENLDSIEVSFYWLGLTGPETYGELYYSNDQGTVWTKLTDPIANFYNQSTWTQAKFSIPAFVNLASLRFAFRFVNTDATTYADPAFSIDEFKITGFIKGNELKSSFCGTNLTALNQQVLCNPKGGATDYKYEISDGTNTFTYIKGSNAQGFRLTLATTPSYGTTYSVKVAWNNGAFWSDFGDACTLTTPFTKLQDKFCNTTVTTLRDFLSYYPVANATNYKLEAFDGSNTLEYTKNGTGLTFKMNQFPGVQFNKTYQVKVAAYVGGAWQDFGAVCTITTPTLREGNFDNPDMITSSTLDFSIFPNPNNGEFSLTSAMEGKFEILNELGQSVQFIKTSKENNYEIKVSGLNAGVYFVKGNGVVVKVVVH